ncbi:MAG: S8 family serine peptidase, partial [Anaerolineae bacterium]|nr:S8 family serine peptidase [Anaerolineae bacterium]
ILYPAAYDGAIAVGSVDPDLQRSSFSTYGPQIALLAPGRDILTTGSDGAYVTLSGTSLAAPHVTGVAALELALGRSLTVNGGVVSVGGSAAQPATPVPVVIPPQYQDLYDKAANGEDLKLIVQLNVPYQSASQLTTAQAAAQQASIQQVRSALINDLAAYSAVIHEGSKTWHLPYLALRAGASAVAYLANSPEITGMAEDRPMVKQLGRSIPFIDADNVYALGYDGSGQVVAILDDGIDAGHEFFGGRVVEEACVSNSYEDPNDRSLCPNNDWLQLGPGAADISRCQLYGDDCDHGTHVAGIAAGNGGPVDVPNGVAKGASIIAVQIFTVTYSCSSAPCYVAYTADQLTAMDYILYLTDSYNIAAVNLSLGTTATYPPSVCINDFLGGLQYTMIDDLSAAGVATVIAAGNNGLAPNYNQGNPNALSFPACLPNSVSVGSVGSYGSMGAISNSVSLFSNDSAELDLLAPGGYIQSAGLNDTYRWDGGTSMAAPHVTGAFAVLKQANPDATVDELLNALKSTGVLVTDFRSSPARIKPRIDLDNALAVIVPPVLVVNKTADTNDGICDADCSLREALTVANGTTGIKETIKFNIGGGGLQTMVLNGAAYGPLPAITDSVIIDGTTQPGYSGSPLIEIDGSNVADSTPELNLGLNIPVGNSTVRGLVINRFLYGGIGLTFSGNNILEANYVGTEPDGTTAAPNLYGVIICSSDDNHVGGPLASQRNLISGNLDDGINLCQLPGGLFPVADNNVIQGNYIGVDVTGSARLANGDDGIKIEDAITTLIGGLATGAGNVISGNTNGGVTIIGPVSNGNWIQGNIIGPNAAGTQMLTGNVSNADGIYLSDSSDNLIGGSSDGAGNLISGNLRAIRLVGTSANNDIRGNRIGTNAAGTAALPNQNQIGIILGESGDVGVVDNLVGGTTPGAGNVIAGNQGVGISVVGSSNVIQGNFVGTDASASLDLGNAGSGILLQSDDNLIGGTASGAGNVIAHNAGYGIGIGGAAPADLIANTILSNRIFDHDALGLDLNLDGVTANDSGDGDTGPNNLQNFPVLTEVTASLNQAAISGTLNSAPNSTFRVELFLNDACDSSGYGEGQTFLGGFDDVTTDGSGSAAFSFELFGAFSAGSQVTATATSVDDDTSEFSACEPVVLDPNILVVNTTSGVNDGVCDAQCSLADAIAVSNGMPGAQTVIFEIPGSAPYTIQPTAVLPTFGDLTIDGTTQPGYAGSPIIVLDGSFFTSGFVHGLTVNSNSTIRGMVIHSFRGYGIKLLGNDNIVQGNYLGIDVTGTLEQGNYEGGVDASGHNNLIGGTTA